MTTCKLWARLGNQMFMIAAAYAYSLRYNMDYFVPHTRYSDYFPKVKKGEDTHTRYYHYKESVFSYQPIPYRENIKLDGYFQSHDYFKDYHNEVVELFGLPDNPLKGWVSVHWRLGDYLQHSDKFPPVTKQYFETAMSKFAAMGYNKFFCFSDGMRQTKQLLNNDNYPMYEFRYSEGKSELEDLILLSNCTHGIISNSSYSLIGRLLCRNKDAINISPSHNNWFGKLLPLDTSTIIPDNFTQITF